MKTSSQTQTKDGVTVELGTLEHEGKEFSALGSVVDPAAGYILGYVKDGTLTTWTGEFICKLERVSTWKVQSWVSSTRSAYRATYQGRRYHGRGYGEGMSLILRSKG